MRPPAGRRALNLVFAPAALAGSPAGTSESTAAGPQEAQGPWPGPTPGWSAPAGAGPDSGSGPGSGAGAGATGGVSGFPDLSGFPDSDLFRADGADGADGGGVVGSEAGAASGLSFAELDRMNEIEALAAPDDPNGDEDLAEGAELLEHLAEEVFNILRWRLAAERERNLS